MKNNQIEKLIQEVTQKQNDKDEKIVNRNAYFIVKYINFFPEGCHCKYLIDPVNGAFVKDYGVPVALYGDKEDGIVGIEEETTAYDVNNFKGYLSERALIILESSLEKARNSIKQEKLVK